MSFDAETMFSDGQTIAAGNSTNTVELPKGDVGRGGYPPRLQVVVKDVVGTGGLNVQVQTSDNSSMAGAVNVATYHIASDDLLRGGPVLTAALPTGCKRYMRLGYSLGGTLSSGTLTAGLVLGGQTNI